MKSTYVKQTTTAVKPIDSPSSLLRRDENDGLAPLRVALITAMHIARIVVTEPTFLRLALGIFLLLACIVTGDAAFASVKDT